MITLDEIMSREPALLGHYETSSGKKSEIYLAQVFVLPNAHMDISYLNSNGITDDKVRALSGVDANVPVQRSDQAIQLQLPNIRVRIPITTNADLERKLPQLEEFSEQLESVVAPIQDTMRICPLLRSYLMAYGLGMLVRYFPSKWMSLVRNEKSDRAQPLLMFAVRHLESEFPRQLADSVS